MGTGQQQGLSGAVEICACLWVAPAVPCGHPLPQHQTSRSLIKLSHRIPEVRTFHAQWK